jgi:gamma-glutamyl-gamma-aminobutyrate hydrolase PuuD
MAAVTPRIGISAYWRSASWGPWADYPACMVPQGYVIGVRAAGGAPLLVPPDATYARDPDIVLDVLDGLLMVGGEDIGPAAYGARPHPATDPPNVVRDEAESALLAAAVARDMPVLAVCRGMQMLNVVYGGDLVQEIGDHTDSAPHRPQLGTFGRHDVDVESGRLLDLVGPLVTRVHSHHHQGLGRLGEGLAITARSGDGLPEAIEDARKRFMLGVLWHPEEDPEGAGAPLFRGLVKEAAAYRERRA